MPPTRSKAELEQSKKKLANSYNELLQEFSAKDLRRVGNYTLDRLIGKGSFGKVYLARHNLTNGSKVVLKSSKKDDSNLAREIHHHRQFLHPHIVRLYEVIVTESLVWLALEYCPGDELYNYLLAKGALPVEKVQKIFTQLVGGVSYIHNRLCVHRDLKLENILLDKHENVKLIDFGFTREYEGNASYLQTFCGTICYSAPEMLKGEKYAAQKVDVWSLGIILYALLTGELPFDEDDDQATKAKILKEEPKYPDNFPQQAKKLCSKMLAKRPFHRPTLADILADPFLAEYAPQQQAVLKLTQPAPFTTTLEKSTLERMKSAGVNIDQIIESVLAQRCDNLAGWWALLIEKEERKEARRERKRKEREAELKATRRTSAASSRLLAPTLAEVSEEQPLSPAKSSNDDELKPRGRRDRRNTPQMAAPDLPKLPEGTAIDSPTSITPPVPLDKDSVRSSSTSRPPPPPKDYRRRSSHLQLVTSNHDLLHGNGVAKRRSNRRNPQSFIGQLVSLKHWFVESAKRAKSPGKSPGHFLSKSSPKLKDASDSSQPATTPTQPRSRPNSRKDASRPITQSSSLMASAPAKRVSSLHGTRPLSTYSQYQRDSLSPAPLTPRSNSYRRGSAGLRGRKSTSSSVSSIRSIHHRHSHSKASSNSSRNSLDTTSTPTTKSVTRSPHSSIKVLPVTPQTSTPLPSNIRLVRQPHGAAEPLKPSPFLSDVSPVPASPPGGLVYARRKKSPFRGPTINTSFPPLGVSNGLGTPGLKGRHDSTTVLSTLDSGSVGNRRVNQRDLPTTTEEEEEEEDIEEVDAFSPVIIKRGESIHTITMLDDRGNPTENTADPDENVLANEEPNALNANAPTLETTSGPTEAK